MELSSITIENYKSIKSPININLSTENKLYTFIGKNGSGKTNILAAIKDSLCIPSYYYNQDKNINLKSSFEIKLTKEDFSYYFNIDHETENITINYLNQNNNRDETAKSPFLKELVLVYKKKLKGLIEKYKKITSRYLNNLKQIEDSYPNNVFSLEPTTNVNGTMQGYSKFYIDENKKKLTTDIEELDKYLSNNFKNDTLQINHDLNYHYTSIYRDTKLYDIKCNLGKGLFISPVIAKSLNLTEEDIKKGNLKLNEEIQKINKQLENDYNLLNEIITDIHDTIDTIIYMFSDGDNISEQYNPVIIHKFYQDLQSHCFRNTYFIDNEHSLLFRESRNEYIDNRISPQYINNIQNPIIQALDNYLIENKFYKVTGTDENGKDVYESITDLGKLTNRRQNELKNYINKNLFTKFKPNFEKEEIQNYEININDNKLSLWVTEQSGLKINFDDTSLGRRWYLTYKIIKELIHPGDLLFIDEPAAFLHPNAQVEFRRELECLSEDGVYVFITTHSPYMINTTFDNVYNVTIDNKTTKAELLKTKDSILPVIQDEIGVIRTNDILFELSNTILLVEGNSDETCLRKFAKILNYNLTDFKITICYGSPIIHIAYLCEEQGIKYKALLDLDNKSKSDAFLNYHNGYIKFIKEITNNPNCVFTPAIQFKKCLEDCFVGEDREKYLDKQSKQDSDRHMKNGEYAGPKINIRKVKSAQTFTDGTKNNFEQLFRQLGIPHIDNKHKK